jgi:hypothetical protein
MSYPPKNVRWTTSHRIETMTVASGEGMESLEVYLHDWDSIRESLRWRNGNQMVSASKLTKRESWRWCDTGERWLRRREWESGSY